MCQKCTVAADDVITGFPTRRCALRRSLNAVAGVLNDYVIILNVSAKRFRMLYLHISNIRPF